MGYTSESFTSTGLTPLHPSHYKEFQITNWTCEEIVITESSGEQFVQPRAVVPLNDNSQCVVIEYRSGDGMRIDENSRTPVTASPQLPLNAKRISVPLADFRHTPVRIEEFNCIISTVDQAIIAKNMMCDYNYGSLLSETSVDAQLVDPRLVFQVIDPNNEWEVLFVSLFGTTVILRSGRFNRLTGSKPSGFNMPEVGRLIGYLRYPTDAFYGSRNRQVVFDIPLTDIDKKEPYRLPNGDYICVATDPASLGEVVRKKAKYTSGNAVDAVVQSETMVPKKLFDSTVENYKAEIKRIQEVSNNKMEAAVATLRAENAKLKQDLVDAQHLREAAEANSRSWEQANKARATYDENRLKVDAAVEKARKEALESARSDIDNMWTVLKIGGTVAAGVLSFALTTLIKNKGK